MNSPDPKIASESIEKIEKELQEIDQIVRSWSDGRKLRFDPAHVKPTAKNDEKQIRAAEHKQRSNNLLELTVRICQGMLALTLVTILVQVFFSPLTYSVAFGLMAATTLGFAGAMLFLLVWCRAVTKPYWKVVRSTARSTQSSAARSDMEKMQ